MFGPEKSVTWLRKNAPAGAEWATIDGEFFYKIVDGCVMMHTSLGTWMQSSQIADDIFNSYFFVNLRKSK